MSTTYVRKDNPNEVLGTFSDEELGMKMNQPQYENLTERERLEKLGYVAKPTQPAQPKVEQKVETKTEMPAGTEGTTGSTEYNDAINAQKGLADFYQSQYDKLQSQFDTYTADIALIDSENVPIINDIKATFERRKAEMEKLNTSMQGQLGLTQNRTGMARYAPETASGFISNEITNGMNRLSELESQKLQAIAEAKRALKSDAEDKWRVFNEMMKNATTAYENKVTAVKDLHAMVKDEEESVIKRQVADLNLQQLKRENQQLTAESIASSVYSVLGDDIDGNMQFIAETAKEYGVDPNVLIGAINNYAQEDLKSSLDLQKDLLSIGEKIPEGETREIYPGVIVTGTSKKDQMWVESIVGNQKFKDLYVKQDGEYIRTQRISLGQAYKPTTTSSAKMTDEFKQWYYKTFDEIPWETDQNVIDEWKRWSAVGGVKKDEDPVVSRQVVIGDWIIFYDKQGNEIKRISKEDNEESDNEFDKYTKETE